MNAAAIDSATDSDPLRRLAYVSSMLPSVSAISEWRTLAV